MTSPARAHTIEPCYCDSGCFTDEVHGLSCQAGKARFQSSGLPDASQDMMRGITATNQQFPSRHNYQFEINTKPRLQSTTTPTEAGPIGVAVNGVPLFDPSTQGPANRATGKRPDAYEAGELDDCGGHAGRGDDYHYHIAPKCLIDALGPEKIEIRKQPIGFAMDGFPILALGWFEKQNDVEGSLDKCRGMKDQSGRYFYNVKTTAKWDLINCFHGTPHRFARDTWRHRKDKNNREIVGLPIAFKIDDSRSSSHASDVCHVMSGVMGNEQLLRSNGSTWRQGSKQGSLFHCNRGCYGLFFEADKKPQFRGRVLYYDLIMETCPADFDRADLAPFDAYTGAAQTYKGPPPTGKRREGGQRQPKRPRDDNGTPPPRKP